MFSRSLSRDLLERPSRTMSLNAPLQQLHCLVRIPVLTAVALFLSAAAASAQDKIQRWHDSLDRGVEAARKSNKPLFVVFRCVR